ncbi:Rhodanese-like domain-containing protein [Plectosphaerella plurivora]|uniref:Rhodanese-like domain-containing protein n=1 Tax=Plectosphaerella plurivora TaxID=936078 RepID=A0A9P9ABH6_9PEZI|nr:Rhodanese-like domain-containing protein [Plectosphaerella plurivora]
MAFRAALTGSRGLRISAGAAQRTYTTFTRTKCATTIAATAPTTCLRARMAPTATRSTLRMFSSSKDAEDYHEMTPRGTKLWNFEQVKKAATGSGKVVIVDTREPGELEQTGSIPGALNIPISSRPESFFITDDEFEARYGYDRPAKDTELVFFCKAGVRSRAAATLAKEAGWTNIGEYPGSWLDWEKNGGPTEKANHNRGPQM